MNVIHVKQEIKQELIETLVRLKKQTGLPIKLFVKILGISNQKVIDWKKNGVKKEKKNIPKSHWSTPEERCAVVEFKKENMHLGYVRLTWMMIDKDIAYLSPSSVYRILVGAALNNKWTKPACEPKKEGFDQPVRIHEHWHLDISYLNYKGTFVYLICVLDGYSRAILSWDICIRMESFDVQIVLWRTCEKYLQAEDPNNPRLITDNGSQFLTKEFKDTLKFFSMKNVRTSVNHPQSNGKIERFHGTIKSEKIRSMPILNLEQMKSEVGEWIELYNNERLHSALQYVTPMDVMNGKQQEIINERKRKLIEGKKMRKLYSLSGK